MPQLHCRNASGFLAVQSQILLFNFLPVIQADDPVALRLEADVHARSGGRVPDYRSPMRRLTTHSAQSPAIASALPHEGVEVRHLPVALAVEHDRNAAQTYRANNPGQQSHSGIPTSTSEQPVQSAVEGSYLTHRRPDLWAQDLSTRSAASARS